MEGGGGGGERICPNMMIINIRLPSCSVFANKLTNTHTSL